MKYSEIHRSYYAEARNAQDSARFWLLFRPQVRLAWLILRFFSDRSGFGGWWDEINQDTKDDLFDHLVVFLENNITN